MYDDLKTWRKKIVSLMGYTGDSEKNIIQAVIATKSGNVCGWDRPEWDLEFDGAPFCVWTTDYVYFPVVEYDESESVDCVRRNPGPHPLPVDHTGGMYEEE